MLRWHRFVWVAVVALAGWADGPPAAAAEDDGGYIFEHNERKPEELAAARERIPAVDLALPSDRLQRLPQTMKRLREGGTLRIVMLGDSIINDTARSCWHELVGKQYPQCQIVRVVSVRGGTGCWFYKQPGKIDRYVVQQRPDLVIIGGISQNHDVASIRECIRQIQEAGCRCEFFLMTGPYGGADPLSGEPWRKDVHGGKDEVYAAELKQLADELNAEYFDLQAAWGEYLRAAGKPLDFFKRDPVHANAEGEAVLARILEQYFLPPGAAIGPSEAETIGKRLDWFQDQKFGLMMHWAPYSQWGCIESWPLVEVDAWARPDDLQAWVERDRDLARFQRDYWELPKTFHPVNFDPAKWADSAETAGMKYVVFTTKHHDGFCMFDTRLSDYRITAPAVPFHADPRANVVRGVFDAFRQRGFGIGAYFSKADWHSPYYWKPGAPARTRNPNYDTAAEPETWRKFVQYTHGQIEELVTGYGPIDILWLDAGQVRPPEQDLDMDRLAAMARSHQPGLILVDRTVGGRYENYRTPEQEVPAEPLGYVWETCMTMGDQWSFKPNDKYKSTHRLIHLLVDIVAKGGNFLLNVGPQPDGQLPEVAVGRLQEVGAWLQVNGEAIYSTRPIAPYKEGPIAFTQGAGNFYAIVLREEGSTSLPAEIVLRVLRPAPGSRVQLLGSDVALDWRTADDGRAVIRIPEAIRNGPPTPHASVIRCERDEAGG